MNIERTLFEVTRNVEDAQDALRPLPKALATVESAKGVFVLGAAEKAEIDGALASVAKALAAALALTGQVATEPRRGVPFRRERFDKYMHLRWDDSSDADGADLTLYDQDMRVGHVVQTEADAFKWSCVVSDWRDTVETLQEAKDALVSNYATHYAEQARDLVRAHVPKTPAG